MKYNFKTNIYLQKKKNLSMLAKNSNYFTSDMHWK
jgi:hypothetical protein